MDIKAYRYWLMHDPQAYEEMLQARALGPCPMWNSGFLPTPASAASAAVGPPSLLGQNQDIGCITALASAPAAADDTPSLLSHEEDARLPGEQQMRPEGGSQQVMAAAAEETQSTAEETQSTAIAEPSGMDHTTTPVFILVRATLLDLFGHA